MTKIEAVIFDVDGTLLNTFEHIVQAFEVVLPKHGIKPDREQIRTVIGMTLIDCYKTLAPEGDYEAMAELYHETQQTPEMYALIVAYDNLRETLEALKNKGIKTAVQTNRQRKSIDLIFDHVAITDMFDSVLTPQEVSRPKPDPEGIQIIAKTLAVAPHAIAMVGDTHFDIQAGKNAGAGLTVGLTHGFGTRDELVAAKADVIIDSLADLPKLILNRK